MLGSKRRIFRKYGQRNQSYVLSGHVHHSMKAEKPLNAIVVLSSIAGFVKFT